MERGKDPEDMTLTELFETALEMCRRGECIQKLQEEVLKRTVLIELEED